jgi:hypothetical protein
MIKKERGDNVTWQKREIKEEKIKKRMGHRRHTGLCF